MRSLFVIVMSFGVPLFGLAGCGMFLSAGYGSSVNATPTPIAAPAPTR